MTFLDHILYAALWLSFGIGHSVLASATVKDALKGLFDASYRLSYNIFAVIHIALVLWAGRVFLSDGARGFGIPESGMVAMDMARVLGIVLMGAAVLHYDLGRFGGLTQILERLRGEAEQTEPFRATGLLRFVRHPIYSGAHLFLWASATNEFAAATAGWGSLYLLIGAWYEEQRLIRLYGDDYRAYRTRVSSIIPWKGRAI